MNKTPLTRIWDVKYKRYTEDCFVSLDGLALLFFDKGQTFLLPILNSSKEPNFVVELNSQMKDSKNNLIYENDIIEITYALHEHAEVSELDLKQVLFEDGCFCTDEDTLDNYKLKPKSSIKVVGNINEKQVQ
jgi:hypothetical protein